MDKSAGEGLNDGVVPWVWEVLQQIIKWAFACDVVLYDEAQERQHGQSPISKLFLFRLQCGFEVERVEDDTPRISHLIRRQAIILEDGILIHTSWVLYILPTPDLHIVKEDKLDHEECGGGGEVICFAGVEPLGGVDKP